LGINDEGKPSNIDEHIAEWGRLITLYGNAVNALRERSAEYGLDELRVGLYALPCKGLIYGLVNTKMIKTCLLSEEWWRANVTPYGSIREMQLSLDNHVRRTEFVSFMLFFSNYEAELRELLRSLFPGVCDNGAAPFEGIYECLLSRLDLKHHIDLLSFSRCIRNLIHNNGTYYSRKGTDEHHIFEGKEYHFSYGKPVGFVYPDILHRIYERTLEVSADLNAHTDVIALSGRKAPMVYDT
jgi:hypothetical protein